MEEFCLSLCTPFPSLSLQLLRIKGERMAFVFKLDWIVLVWCIGAALMCVCVRMCVMA